MAKTDYCCPECMSENISYEENKVLSVTATIGIKVAKSMICEAIGIKNYSKIPNQPVNYYKCHDCGAIFFTPLKIE